MRYKRLMVEDKKYATVISSCILIFTAAVQKSDLTDELLQTIHVQKKRCILC